MGSSWSGSWPPASPISTSRCVGRASTSEDESDPRRPGRRRAAGEHARGRHPPGAGEYPAGESHLPLRRGSRQRRFRGRCRRWHRGHPLPRLLHLGSGRPRPGDDSGPQPAHRRAGPRLREGAWVEHGPSTRRILRGPIQPLREQTLGIVGFGRIGQAVAARAKPFNLTIVAADPYIDPEVMVAAGVEPAPLRNCCGARISSPCILRSRRRRAG